MLISDMSMLFPCFVQVRLPHDDNDMYDWHVLPAGHPNRTGMEHIVRSCCWRERDTLTTPQMPSVCKVLLYVTWWWSAYRHDMKHSSNSIRNFDHVSIVALFSFINHITERKCALNNWGNKNVPRIKVHGATASVDIIGACKSLYIQYGFSCQTEQISFCRNYTRNHNTQWKGFYNVYCLIFVQIWTPSEWI